MSGKKGPPFTGTAVFPQDRWLQAAALTLLALAPHVPLLTVSTRLRTSSVHAHRAFFDFDVLINTDLGFCGSVCVCALGPLYVYL